MLCLKTSILYQTDINSPTQSTLIQFAQENRFMKCFDVFIFNCHVSECKYCFVRMAKPNVVACVKHKYDYLPSEMSAFTDLRCLDLFCSEKELNTFTVFIFLKYIHSIVCSSIFVTSYLFQFFQANCRIKWDLKKFNKKLLIYQRSLSKGVFPLTLFAIPYLVRYLFDVY